MLITIINFWEMIITGGNVIDLKKGGLCMVGQLAAVEMVHMYEGYSISEED